jgi:hypothetical protein
MTKLRVRPFLAGALLLLSQTFGPAAWAWQTIQAGSSGATVYSQSSNSSSVAGKVDAGKKMTASDTPTNGFYRVNAGGGITGWVSQSEVVGAKAAPAAAPRAAARSSSPSYARSSSGGDLSQSTYLGALLGMGFYSGGSKILFGVDGGLKLSPDWGLGLYFTYNSLGSATVGAASSSASMMVIAGELNYFLQDMKGLHLGAKLGLAMASTTTSGTGTALDGSTSSSGAAYGIGAGYDVPLSHEISLGGEANFLILSSSGGSSTSSAGGSTTTTDTSSSTSVFNLIASLKYWF